MAYKGFKFTEESKRKMSLARKSVVIKPSTRAKMSKLFSGKSNPFYGKKHSEETKLKISLAKKGKPNWKPTVEQRLAKSLAQRGEKGSNWQGGKTKKHHSIRNSVEYKLWRTAVFERDNWTCIWCGLRGGELNADHIKPFCDYPELRFALDNGRTLCLDCHKTTDTWGFNYYNNKIKNGAK